MAYDFTTLIDRVEIGSNKWAEMLASKPDVSKGVIPFSVADMEFKNPPEIVEAIKNWVDKGILGYTMPREEYYNAVCGWMQRRHSLSVNPAEILISPGVVSALFFSVRMLAKRGEGVIVMPPVYGPFYQAVERTGRKLIKCPLTENELNYSMDFEKLDELCSREDTKLLLFCSPHNPVGRVWTEQELRRVAEICIRHNVYVVSDEIHCDIIMPGYKHYSMGRIEELWDRLILCTAPSKTFNLAAMQISNIIIKNEELRQRFKEFMECCFVESVNALGFTACTAAYNKCQGWMEEMLETVYGNYRYVSDFLAEHIPAVKAPKLMGTYLVWLDMRALNLKGESLEEHMAKYELFFSPGKFFGNEGFVRMNLACPRACIEQGMDRLKIACSV